MRCAAELMSDESDERAISDRQRDLNKRAVSEHKRCRRQLAHRITTCASPFISRDETGSDAMAQSVRCHFDAPAMP